MTCLVRTENSAENCAPGHDCAECEHYEETCQCGGIIIDATEITSAQPTGTGYVLRVCEDCGTEYDRHYAGH